MKKMNRLLALCLAMLMMLSTAAWAEETTTEETAADPVVFTFNGEDVLRSQLENTLYNLYSNGYVTSETDYATAIDYMLEEKVILTQIKAQGLDQFTQEEEDAFKADAMADWEATIDSYVSYFLSEDTDEARAKARQDGDAYLRSYGYTPEMLIEGYRNTAAFEKLQEKIFEGKNTEATEEEIVEVFEQYAAEDKAMYEGDFATYELYQNYGYTSWYKPEGFRGIIHILLEVDEELLTAYENAQALYEESLSAEEGAAAENATTKEDVDAALQAVLDSQKAAIDDIYARLEKGESFETLIAEYGTDPGMQDETNLKNGYEVHADSTMTWIPEFVDAAFSEKMQKPGDVSDPVVASYGIHILYYLRDIPGGYVEITDDIRTSIVDYLVSTKKNEIYLEAIEGWKADCQIVYNQELIDALTGVAAE